jgi:hypothetical protein
MNIKITLSHLFVKMDVILKVMGLVDIVKRNQVEKIFLRLESF